ncbi:MAG: hypothetical protein ACLQVJ_15340 [Syntrophobacteraceae bacterium]
MVCAEAYIGTPHKKTRRLTQPGRKRALSSFISISVIAWIVWFIFSDLRGPLHYFPYPFMMYIGIMIIVALWQHVSFTNWPFMGLPRPLRGVVMTVVNLVVTWLVINVVFYKILGLGFNFLSEPNLEALAAAGKTNMPTGASVQTIFRLN